MKSQFLQSMRIRGRTMEKKTLHEDLNPIQSTFTSMSQVARIKLRPITRMFLIFVNSPVPHEPLMNVPPKDHEYPQSCQCRRMWWLTRRALQRHYRLIFTSTECSRGTNP